MADAVEGLSTVVIRLKASVADRQVAAEEALAAVRKSSSPRYNSLAEPLAVGSASVFSEWYLHDLLHLELSPDDVGVDGFANTSLRHFKHILNYNAKASRYSSLHNPNSVMMQRRTMAAASPSSPEKKGVPSSPPSLAKVGGGPYTEGEKEEALTPDEVITELCEAVARRIAQLGPKLKRINVDQLTHSGVFSLLSAVVRGQPNDGSEMLNKRIRAVLDARRVATLEASAVRALPSEDLWRSFNNEGASADAGGQPDQHFTQLVKLLEEKVEENRRALAQLDAGSLLSATHAPTASPSSPSSSQPTTARTRGVSPRKALEDAIATDAAVLASSGAAPIEPQPTPPQALAPTIQGMVSLHVGQVNGACDSFLKHKRSDPSRIASDLAKLDAYMREQSAANAAAEAQHTKAQQGAVDRVEVLNKEMRDAVEEAAVLQKRIASMSREREGLVSTLARGNGVEQQRRLKHRAIGQACERYRDCLVAAEDSSTGGEGAEECDVARQYADILRDCAAACSDLLLRGLSSSRASASTSSAPAAKEGGVGAREGPLNRMLDLPMATAATSVALGGARHRASVVDLSLANAPLGSASTTPTKVGAEGGVAGVEDSLGVFRRTILQDYHDSLTALGFNLMAEVMRAENPCEGGGGGSVSDWGLSAGGTDGLSPEALARGGGLAGRRTSVGGDSDTNNYSSNSDDNTSPRIKAIKQRVEEVEAEYKALLAEAQRHGIALLNVTGGEKAVAEEELDGGAAIAKKSGHGGSALVDEGEKQMQTILSGMLQPLLRDRFDAFAVAYEPALRNNTQGVQSFHGHVIGRTPLIVEDPDAVLGVTVHQTRPSGGLATSTVRGSNDASPMLMAAPRAGSSTRLVAPPPAVLGSYGVGGVDGRASPMGVSGWSSAPTSARRPPLGDEASSPQ